MRIESVAMDIRIYAIKNGNCDDFHTENYMTFNLDELSETFDQIDCGHTDYFNDNTFERLASFSTEFSCSTKVEPLELEGHVLSRFTKEFKHAHTDLVVRVYIDTGEDDFEVTHSLASNYKSSCVNGSEIQYVQEYSSERAKFSVELDNIPWKDANRPSTLFFHPKGKFVGEETAMFNHYVKDGFHHSVLQSDDFDIILRIHNGFQVTYEGTEDVSIGAVALETYLYTCNGQNFTNPVLCFLSMNNQTKNIDFSMLLRLGDESLEKFSYLIYDPDFRVLFKLGDDKETSGGAFLAYIIAPIAVVVVVVIIIVVFIVVKNRKKTKRQEEFEMSNDQVTSVDADASWKKGEKPETA